MLVSTLANETSPIEPKKRSRRFYLVVFVAILLLTLIVDIAVYDVYVGRTSYGPGPVEIEVTTDKQFYLQGEEATFTICVNNPQNWPVPYPHSIVGVIEKDGVYIAGVGGGQIDYAGVPTFPPHSKTLSWASLMWNQKSDVNGTLVQVHSGNYTYIVTFGGLVDYGNSGNCTFEIR
jgi:hypothetical protein